MRFLQKRVGLLEGVCITGGEPTLQKDLPQLLEKIKALGYAVKLDTNGSRPEGLKELVSRGLVDYVAMDIKNSPERYAETCGGTDILNEVRQSAALLMDDRLDYEFRTTVIAQLHDFQSMEKMGSWVSMLAENKKVKRWFVQPFADRETVMYSGLCAPCDTQLSEFVSTLGRFSSHSSRRG